MFKAVFSCLRALAMSLEIISGVIIGAFGTALDLSGLADIPLWMWFAFAVVPITISAVRLQWRLQEGPYISKLRLKPYVTFGEIAENVSKAKKEYSKKEIMAKLLTAIEGGDFCDRGGKSRAMFTLETSEYHSEVERIPFEAKDGFDSSSEGGEAYHRAFLNNALDENATEADEYITLSNRDFSRWYSSFLSGRYEK